MDLLKFYVMSQLPYKAQIEAENEPQKICPIADLLTTIEQAVKTLLGAVVLPVWPVLTLFGLSSITV